MVKHTFIRVLLSIVASKDLELDQLDVKTDFLHGLFAQEKTHGLFAKKVNVWTKTVTKMLIQEV